MKIKVCGMTRPDNIRRLAALPVDMIGLVFHAASPRRVGPHLVRSPLPAVGVFVDAPFDRVVATARHYRLAALQLHGGESPDLCSAFRARGFTVIKALHVSAPGDLRLAAGYHGAVDYLLFDTRGVLPGGSGRKFDWEILQYYTGPTPFFLSGGIAPGDAAALRRLAHPFLHALDLNSRFETAPGVKDVGAIARFIEDIRETKL
jgi:phosphoribosylanthranilate isomerase